MDAVKFVNEYLRMCAKASCCEECPAFMTDFCTVNAEERSPESAEQIVALVEKWSKENLRKTRQDVFLEQWPETYILGDGYLDVCPLEVSAAHRDVNGDCAIYNRLCTDCRREFWMQAVE